MIGAITDELLDRVSARMRHERQLNADLAHGPRMQLARAMTEAKSRSAAPTVSGPQRCKQSGTTAPN